MKKIVFTSGLPRSGSTLLSAILNQNPRFDANVVSPILPIMQAVIEAMNSKGNNKILVSDKTKDNILRGILENYHDIENKEVFFNHNRKWSDQTEILKRLYPDFKMIITVRDIGWILDSFENLTRKKPYNKTSYSNSYIISNIYSRCEEYMSLIYEPYFSIKDAIYSNVSNYMIIEYDVLVSQPEFVIRSLYNHIEEPYFQHDFNNIKNIPNSEIVDIDINMPGLHHVKKVITPPNRQTIIPPDIWERYSGMEIWKNLKS